MERFKDVEVAGVRYRVEKMPAKTAAWIAMQVFTKILPSQIEQQLNIVLPQNRGDMSEEDFSKFIDYCLLSAKRYEKVGQADVPMPILASKGVWAIHEMEHDFTAVIGLTVHVLAFNVAAFFNEGVLQELAKSLKDIPLFNTPQSTVSSSPR